MRLEIDGVFDDDGNFVGNILTAFWQPNRPYLAQLPDYQSAGQKSHKAFATADAARDWLIRQASRGNHVGKRSS